jgi:hypothetical protein
MTLGVGYEDRGDLASLLSEVADRKVVSLSQRAFDVSPTYEVTRTIDPSDGGNYSGGSSYSPGLPLLPSNAGLAGYGGNIRNIDYGVSTYGEAMNWTPAPLTQRIDALKAGAGRSFEGLGALGALGNAATMNPLWYVLAAGTLAYLFFRPKEARYY